MSSASIGTPTTESPDFEACAKSIEQVHLYIRQLYEVRMQWSRFLLFANTAGIAWMAATQFRPPLLAIAHVAVTMIIFNAIGVWTTRAAKRHFAELASQVQKIVETLAPSDEAIMSLSRAFPKEAYEFSLSAIILMIRLCSFGWILATLEVALAIRYHL
jgi:hypothetical protein